MENKEFYSISEMAKVLGVSRVAVFKKIKTGLIKAIKIGRMYAIPRDEFGVLAGEIISQAQKEVIDKGVKKTVKEYGETLKLLGKE